MPQIFMQTNHILDRRKQVSGDFTHSLTGGHKKHLSFRGKLPRIIQHHGKPSITRRIRVRSTFHCCCPDVGPARAHSSASCRAMSGPPHDTQAIRSVCGQKYLEAVLISGFNFLRHMCCIAEAGVNDKTHADFFIFLGCRSGCSGKHH